ncbi:MAG: S49 family peptidase [Cyclobacteriaceae bacterium]
MRPQANWQVLLSHEIKRGIFMMNPVIAIGMASFFQKILDPEANFDKSFEREDYPSLSRYHDSDDTYSKYDDAPEGSTALFHITGPMFKYGSWWAYGTEEIAQMIVAAALHKNISSIVLRIDSGGGAVSSLAPLIEAIKLAKAKGKSVVAHVDLCGSCAYYIACECDLTICSNSISSELGSIGVMMDFWDLIPYYEKEGFKHHSIYADQSEDKNKPFKMALEGKYELIKTEYLNPLAIDFQNHVRESRAGKLNEKIPGILNGKTFYAKEAVEHGLADDIGSLSMAIERAQQLATINSFSI